MCTWGIRVTFIKPLLSAQACMKKAPEKTLPHLWVFLPKGTPIDPCLIISEFSQHHYQAQS